MFKWRPLGVPLYLRIWLAVLVAVAVLTVAFGWLWRLNAEQARAPLREVIIRNDKDEIIGQTRQRAIRVPGQGLEFEVAMKDGSTVTVQLPPRQRDAGEGPPPSRSWWARRPGGFLWMLGIVALAVAIGTYPIIRRLTLQLENLRRGVERWGEGDLSIRVNESGPEEVAFLARRFNQAAERIETLVKSHKSLLANASHELRSPLARIRMGLELMEGQPAQSFKDEISRNIAELDQLIDEILLASRLDAREPDVGTVEPVDLTGLVAEECARTGADLVESGDSHTVVVPGVSRLLRRAVRNLLENARRYSGGGPVTAQVGREGGQAVLRVRDHGPGVPAAQRARIFEPFYRLPGASERDGGVGLGLALVKSIIQRHNGSVQCEDQASGGACFVVRLPL